MINLISTFIKIIFYIFKSKRFIVCEIASLKKEIELLKRKRKKGIKTNCFDRLFYVILNKFGNSKDHISIVKPETVNLWQRIIIKGCWTYNRSGKKRGRKATPKETQDLILAMKKENLLWAVKKIKHLFRYQNDMGYPEKFKKKWQSQKIFGLEKVFRNA